MQAGLKALRDLRRRRFSRAVGGGRWVGPWL